MMYFENAENMNENHCRNAVPSKSASLKGQENVLLCANFQERLHIDFGKVSLRESKTINFSLKNPSISKPVKISTSHSSKAGLTISIENAVDNTITIPPLDSCNASLLWTPVLDSTLREAILFKMDDRGSLQVVAEGVAGHGKEEAPKKRQSLDTATKTIVKKTATLRQSLSVIQTVKSEPASVKDIQWVEKQATSFVDWMNYKFADSQVTAPLAMGSDSSDPTPISDLTKKQYEARCKQEAVMILKYSEFRDMAQLIESEVQQQKLQLREDREILQDLGLQEAFFGILFSYELTWLTLGLELMTGKTMKHRPYDNPSRAKAVVKAFVMEHLFNNHEIVSKFPAQAGLYLSQEKKLKGQLKKHLLSQFLKLVMFLDRGRIKNVLPLKSLFVRESIYKSSKDVLISFCRCFLHGEGDIIKHLGLIGYHVQFTQTYIDEINYNVSNLASDLRDGVRLALLVDILTRSSAVTSQLRVPAVSRLQKLHNVSAVLKQLFPEGNSMIESKHIVDGNRDKTLFLLWNIMYAFELRTILSCEQIDAEVEAITAATGSTAAVDVSAAANSSADSDIVASLLSWCNAITVPQGVIVKNLTSSLVDGKALCLLIKHYHPSIMTNSEAALDKESKHISEQRRNFNAILKACKSIGGIPPLLYELDSKVDEKTMLIFLGHLFVRLTESARQVHASTKLQRFFRVKRSKIAQQYATSSNISSTSSSLGVSSKFRKNSFPEHTVVWNEAPVSIVPVAAIAPEMTTEVKDEEPVVAAVIEMTASSETDNETVSSDEVKVEVKEEEEEVTAVEVEKVKEIEMAAPVAAVTVSEADKAREEEEKLASIAAAAAAAELLARQKAEVEKAAAVAAALAEKEAASQKALQSAEFSLKSESEARLALEMRVKAEVEARLALEERLRMMEQKNQDLVSSMQRKEIMVKLSEFTKRRSVRLIQSCYLTHRAKASQRRALRGTVKLQAMVRRALVQRKYLCLVLAIQILQSSWRRKRCARLLVTMEAKAKVIQGVWKRHHTRAQKAQREFSATRLSNWWRTVHHRRSLVVLRSASVRCQSVIRAFLARQQFLRSKKCVMKVQGFFRRCLLKKQSAGRKRAVAVLERSYSAFRFRASVNSALEAQRLAKQNQVKHELECRQKIFGFVQAVLQKRKRTSAVSTISRWFVAMLPLVRVRKLLRGMRRLSAVHRANMIRQHNNAAVAFSLKRIREAELRGQLDPRLRLGNMTQKALQSLCVGSIISDLLKSCQSLEMATEYSEECCAMVVSAKKVDILFGLLRSCNRSESHQELLRTVLVVLLHVARVERLAIAVGDSCEVTDSLVDLLQMFRDKKYLFKLACELLIRFVRASATVKNTCTSTVVFKRLEGIHHIMARKDRLESRLRSIDSRASGVTGYCHTSSVSGARKSLELAEPIFYIQHLMSLLQE